MDSFSIGMTSIVITALLLIGFVTHRTMQRDERMAKLGYCQVYIPASGAQWTKCPEVK